MQDLNKAVRTLQEPSLVVNNVENGKNYNYYIKTFKGNNKVKAHLQIVKKCDDGSFYVTNYSAKNRKLNKVLDNGNIIYKMSDGHRKASVNNIITDNSENLNPNVAEDNKIFGYNADLRHKIINVGFSESDVNNLMDRLASRLGETQQIIQFSRYVTFTKLINNYFPR